MNVAKICTTINIENKILRKKKSYELHSSIHAGGKGGFSKNPL
jgi:hypothetical protein